MYAEDIDAGYGASPSTAMLSKLSQRLKITIVGGSIPERSGDRLYNTCCIFGTDGKIKGKHRKVCICNCMLMLSVQYKSSVYIFSLIAWKTDSLIVGDLTDYFDQLHCYRYISLTLTFQARWPLKNQWLLQQGRVQLLWTQVLYSFSGIDRMMNHWFNYDTCA